MSTEQAQIGAAIAALENQRSVLGDAVVDMAVAPLKAKLAALRGAAVSAGKLRTATPASTCAWACTPAASCWAAVWTLTVPSAASR